jgi:hypothetical protein
MEACRSQKAAAGGARKDDRKQARRHPYANEAARQTCKSQGMERGSAGTDFRSSVQGASQRARRRPSSLPAGNMATHIWAASRPATCRPATSRQAACWPRTGRQAGRRSDGSCNRLIGSQWGHAKALSTGWANFERVASARRAPGQAPAMRPSRARRAPIVRRGVFASRVSARGLRAKLAASAPDVRRHAPIVRQSCASLGRSLALWHLQ